MLTNVQNISWIWNGAVRGAVRLKWCYPPASLVWARGGWNCEDLLRFNLLPLYRLLAGLHTRWIPQTLNKFFICTGGVLFGTEGNWKGWLPKLLYICTQCCLHQNQGCRSAFISSGSGSSILGWIPIRIRIQYGSRALMTKKWKKITAEKKFQFFFYQNLQFTYP